MDLNSIDNRRAGRTSASLRHSLDLMKQGKIVTFVSHSQEMCRVAQDLALRLFRETDPTKLGVSKYCLTHPNGGHISFCSMSSRVRVGVVVPDHFAFETLEERVFRQDHRVRELSAEIEGLKSELSRQRWVFSEKTRELTEAQEKLQASEDEQDKLYRSMATLMKRRTKRESKSRSRSQGRKR